MSKAIRSVEELLEIVKEQAESQGVDDGEPCDTEDLCGHQMCNNFGCIIDKIRRANDVIEGSAQAKEGKP